MGSAEQTETLGTDHRHEAYSHHGHTFRCSCGAVADRGDGPWRHDGTRGCAVCAAPTGETGPEPLCAWHRSIFATEAAGLRRKTVTIDARDPEREAVTTRRDVADVRRALTKREG